MKSLIEVINEGLFSKKKNNPLNLPDKMPKKYVDFFEKYFCDTDGAYPTLPEEQEEFETEAEWTIITEADFKHFAENLAHIQNAIDGVQEKLENSPNYIEYLKITNWNGVLPQVIGDGVNPFVVLEAGSANAAASGTANKNDSNNNEVVVTE